jgi:hypothetical protein
LLARCAGKFIRQHLTLFAIPGKFSGTDRYNGRFFVLHNMVITY